MTSLGKTLRRNFIVAAIVHVALVVTIALVDGFISNTRGNASIPVEVIIPGDIFGDKPVGDGDGKGDYAPPPPAADVSAPPVTAHPNAMSADESVAPTPPPKPVANDPGEIKIPTAKKTPPKPVKKTVAKPASKPVTKTATSSAPSAGDIRARLSGALKAAGSGSGGTPYGDNRPAGGGKATGGVYGSPDGSANGIPGGRGAGTPFWWYYQSVHDRMYEAWEQPGAAVNWDKKLMTTVALRVARDGRILSVTLRGASGNSTMDESAIAAARKVPRLDPLPDGLGGETAEITVNFQLES